MRTAQEMYDYSVKNGTGKGMFADKAGQKGFAIIEKQLMPDEQAEICFVGYHYNAKDENQNCFAYAITNKRLILARKQMLGEAVQFINLDNVNDITMTPGFLSGFIVFDTFKECFKVSFPQKQMTINLFAVINQYFADFKKKEKTAPAPAPASSATVSPADELRKYKQLLDDGIITQEDFDAKKKQLLGL